MDKRIILIFALAFMLATSAHASSKAFTLPSFNANQFYILVGSGGQQSSYYIYDNETIKIRTPELVDILTITYTWDDSLYGGGGGAVLNVTSPTATTGAEIKFEDDEYSEYADVFGQNKIGAQFDECEWTGSGCAEAQFLKVSFTNDFIARAKLAAANAAAVSATNPLAPTPLTVVGVEQAGVILQKTTQAGIEAFRLQNNTGVTLVIDNVKSELIMSNTPLQTNKTIDELASGPAIGTRTIDNLNKPMRINPLTACVVRAPSIYRCQITINQYNGKAFATDSEFYGISIATGPSPETIPTDNLTVNLLTTSLDFKLFQGATQLQKQANGDYELLAEGPIKIVFEGSQKGIRKLIAAPQLSDTSRFDISASTNPPELSSPAELTTGTTYRFTQAEMIISKIKGKPITNETQELLVIGYDLDLDGRNEVYPIKLKSNKLNTTTTFSYVDGAPIPKSDEEPDTYLLTKDGSIRVEIKGIKESSTAILVTQSHLDEIDLANTKVEEYTNDAVEPITTANPEYGINDLELIQFDAAKPYCKASAIAGLIDCSIVIKEIDDEPISKQSEYELRMAYNANGNEWYEEAEFNYYTLKGAPTGCQTILECLNQLDKTIAVKYN